MSPLHSTPLARSNAKPAKGTAQKLYRARVRLHKTIEKAAKAAAKDRDGWRCRRCGSNCWPEAAHIVNSGAGGRPSVSSQRSDYVCMCAECHRTGTPSVHGGKLLIVVLTELGGDGPVRFEYVEKPGQPAGMV